MELLTFSATFYKPSKAFKKQLFMLSLEQLPAKEKKKRLEDSEAKEKEELQALIEKRKKSATKKKNKEKETIKDEYSGKFLFTRK